MKKGVLKNFAKSTGKHLCQSLFFNKVTGLRSATLLKKRLWHRHFPVNFAKSLRTPFVKNTSGRLLLWTTTSETSNTKYLELMKRRSKVQGKNVRWTCFKFWPMKHVFGKLWEFDYGLFTNLSRIVKFTDFSASSFKLKRGILPLLTIYVS